MKQDNTQPSAAKKIQFAVAVACASMMLASPALAQNNSHKDAGPYIGANYGMFKSRGGDFEDENDFFEVLAGYRFNGFFGLEANYTNFGEYGGDLASAEVDGWGVAAVGHLPLSPSFTLYAKAGQFFSTVDVEVAGFRDSFDDDQIFYGIGASFAVAEPVDLIVEYNRYKVEVNDSNWPVELDSSDTDIDTIKVGVRLTF